MTKIKEDPRVHQKNKPAPVRARNEDGTLKADDPNTSDVNEAWKGGVASKKGKSSAKKARKKTATKSRKARS